MKFQKLNIPNGQSEIAELVLCQSWALKSKNNSDCRHSFFYKKKVRSFLY